MKLPGGFDLGNLNEMMKQAQQMQEEMQRVPHLLYGIVSAREAYSVGRWREDAARAIAEARAEGGAAEHRRPPKSERWPAAEVPSL